MIIPTFIIEEHHEAYIVWNYVIQQGLIPPNGNTLFHVDEHSDMVTPRFNLSINELNGDLNKIMEFTYNELNIADFIIPAIYKGYFDKIYWIKQNHTIQRFKSVKMYVRSYNQAGKKLISGKLKSINKMDKPIDMREFQFFSRNIESISLKKKIVLDIDLDFFSCSGNPNELQERYVEITKNEYEDFIKNKYHPLKYYFLGRRIECCEKEGLFYYVINNYKEVYPNKLKVDKNEIACRIGKFVHSLKLNGIIPQIISLCRSRYSGYTPNDQWKYIEKLLVKELKKNYSIQILSGI